MSHELVWMAPPTSRGCAAAVGSGHARGRPPASRARGSGGPARPWWLIPKVGCRRIAGSAAVAAARVRGGSSGPQ